MGRRASGIAAFVAVMIGMFAGQAQAVTLTTLKGQGLDALFGRYAPRGDCASPIRVTIDAAGFTFQAGGRSVQSRRFEYALSFMGPAYDGISAVFFPFPLTDTDPGPVLMIVNANEKPGLLTITSELPKGRKPDPFHAALVAASPLNRCR